MKRATTSLPVPDSPDATSVSCSVTVNDLLRMMSRMQFHEANVVFDGHGAKDRRPHLSADGGDLPTGLIESVVRRLEASAAFGRRCRSARWIHRLVGLCLREFRLLQHPFE